MKILIIFLLVIFSFNVTSLAQSIFYTKKGHINFYSSTPMENINADNHTVVSLINTTNGEIAFSVLIAAFQFSKALMQEHFNENFMESSKYPKAIFQGKIVNLEDIDFAIDGTYQVSVMGDITIHGITKPLTTKGTISITDGKISSNATFYLKPADFDISIPALVRKNIAEELKVTVNSSYEPYSK